jgi:hypothetical protein
MALNKPSGARGVLRVLAYLIGLATTRNCTQPVGVTGDRLKSFIAAWGARETAFTGRTGGVDGRESPKAPSLAYGLIRP